MANKRSRARRNKKSNNWKLISQIKKARKGIHVDQQANQNCMHQKDNAESHSSRFETHEVDAEMNGRCGSVPNFVYETVGDKACELTSFAVYDEQDEPDPLLSDNDIESDADEREEPYDDDADNTNHFDSDENSQAEENAQDSGDEQTITDDEDMPGSDDEGRNADNGVPLKGRRLFDVAKLFDQIKKIGDHSRHCTFRNLDLVSETIQGLNTIYKFKCNKCGSIRKLESCPRKRNAMNVNEDAVLGITSIGSGHYHLKELFTNLDVPVMGNTLYDNIQKKQQDDWFSAAKESALRALYEEIELAEAIGSVDSNGNALIVAISDGGWGKRSYGKAFNSLSGCAVLVGLRTKKIIFYGTRNKYCHTCRIAQSRYTPVKEHECNINYTGPSSGMESDIIMEGFFSCDDHNARIYRLVADGDSNTYKNLRDIRIYTNPDLFIEKFECVNHLHRNFRAKFVHLSTVTKFDVDLRKYIKPKKANDMSNGIKAASKYWRESTASTAEKIKNLEEDIMNAPSHYFGVHQKCKAYFCTKTTSDGAAEVLELLKDDGIYYEVLNMCQHYFAGNVKSLLENYTTNAAEEFNNVVTKYIGGKRINYSLGRSYSARVAAAVVQYNSGGHASSEFRKHKFGSLDNTSIEVLENKRKNKLRANEVSRQLHPMRRQEKREREKNSSKEGYHHGDGAERPDKEPDVFESAKKVHVDKLKNDLRNKKSIEEKTRGGRFNPLWQQLRQDRLPSPFFAKIIKTQQKKSYTGILEELLYKRSEFGNSALIKHQRLVERDALNKFEELFDDYPLQDCGLFIDPVLYFLCATPTKLYGNDDIVNIKCPLKQYGKKFDIAIREIPFWKKENESWELNKQHEWFIELQGDLHVTGRTYGHLMVWLGENLGEAQFRIVTIPRDDTFFHDKMKPKLVYFYENVMVKELVDSRKKRSMDLRKYDPVAEEFV